MQATSSRRRPQRTFVHAELAREVIERQAFGVPHVRRHCRLGSQEHVRRNRPATRYPTSETCSGGRPMSAANACCERSADRRSSRSAVMASTRCHLGRGTVKRPPAYQAGDHGPFRHDLPTRRPRATGRAMPALGSNWRQSGPRSRSRCSVTGSPVCSRGHSREDQFLRASTDLGFGCV